MVAHNILWSIICHNPPLSSERKWRQYARDLALLHGEDKEFEQVRPRLSLCPSIPARACENPLSTAPVFRVAQAKALWTQLAAAPAEDGKTPDEASRELVGQNVLRSCLCRVIVTTVLGGRRAVAVPHCFLYPALPHPR